MNSNPQTDPVYQKLQDDLLDALDEKRLEQLHAALADRFPILHHRLCLARLHNPAALGHGRLGGRDLVRALRYAKKNFPDRELYFYCDATETGDPRIPRIAAPDLSAVRAELAAQEIREIRSLDEIPAGKEAAAPRNAGSEREATNALVILACNSDESLLRELGRARRRGLAFFMPQLTHPAARYYERNDAARAILALEAKLPLKKFDLADFENIVQVIDLTRELKGAYVEVGVYQGRSARVALAYMRAAGLERAAYFLDTYSGFDYDESVRSRDAYWAGRLQDSSLEFVQEQLAAYPNATCLRANVISEDLPGEIGPIAVANVDVDLFDATRAALAKLAPRIVSGGIVIAEDQGHTPLLGGACLATREFLDEHPEFLGVHLASGQMLLIRK